jgi:hypothetical protein
MDNGQFESLYVVLTSIANRLFGIEDSLDSIADSLHKTSTDQGVETALKDLNACIKELQNNKH